MTTIETNERRVRWTWWLMFAVLVLGSAASSFGENFPGFVPRTQSILGPTSIGNNGEVLTSNGAGATSWTAAGGASGWTDGGTNVYSTTGTDLFGINDTTPDAQLDIATSTTGTVGFIVQAGQASQTAALLQINNDTPTALVTVAASGQTIISDGSDVIDYATGVGDLYVGDELEVDGNSQLNNVYLVSAKAIYLKASYNTNATYVSFSRDISAPTGDWKIGISRDSLTTANPASLLVTYEALYSAMGGGEVMVFDPNTYVGIIDTTPDAQLDVATSTTGTVGAIIQAGQAGQTADYLQINDSTPTTLLNVTKDGNLTSKRLATTPTAETITSVTTMVCTSNVMTLTGTATETLTTITGGVSGQLLTLIFVDGNISITDTDAATANTINTSAAFTSTANDTMQLVFDGNKWFEVSRSAN